MDCEVKGKWEQETRLRTAKGDKTKWKMRKKGRGEPRALWPRMMGGRQQWNAVDEVTHMPEAIRRLWLLCYHDFDPPPPPQPTSSLLFILLCITIIAIWAQHAIGRQDVWKPKYPQGPAATLSTFPVKLEAGWEVFCFFVTARVENQKCCRKQRGTK